MSVSSKTRCCARISERGNGFYTYPCSRKAVVTVNGKPYCRQHSPEAKKRRDELSSARYDADSARRNVRWAIERLGLLAVENRASVTGLDFSHYDVAIDKERRAEARLKELEGDKP